MRFGGCEDAELLILRVFMADFRTRQGRSQGLRFKTFRRCPDPPGCAPGTRASILCPASNSNHSFDIKIKLKFRNKNPQIFL
jgi:hypothetical protein